jgi:hypothetical protein
MSNEPVRDFPREFAHPGTGFFRCGHGVHPQAVSRTRIDYNEQLLLSARADRRSERVGRQHRAQTAATGPIRYRNQPTIGERIVEGRQPPELTAQILSTGRGDLPLRWSAQEKLFGFTEQA